MKNKIAIVPDGLYSWSNAEYHAHREILGHSMAIEVIRHPQRLARALTHHAEPTPAQLKGSIWHSYMLEDGKDVEFLDYADFRTKEAKTARETALAEGKYPLLVKDRAELDQAKTVLHANPKIRELLEHPKGKPEVSLVVTDLATGVQIKARPDWLIENNGQITIVDYKTTSDGTCEAFEKTAGVFGYFVQVAWYKLTYSLLYPKISRKQIDFLFLAQETDPPYAAYLHRIDMDSEAMGYIWADQAMRLWQAHGGGNPDAWPPSAPEITQIIVPTWATRLPEGSLA
ncbi:hypothetical protein HHJ78_10975 [Mobiluncus mulieris]|uniref:Putative exodeoxyribonuclease 8 PDDEXK-like domain-containing protein n=1 Tax=Mobiluncus mulieris TaxID=2052 RepID=A0A7Y0U3A1_9ACTO|nr:PD-(D/E)XK nuclease-like domain-containing protein [Mobiluncus mulieris]NMW66007.1 hypothetical protein [Mobiluncus mulieris]